MKNIFVDGHIFDKEFQGTVTFVRNLYRSLSKFDDIKIAIGVKNINNAKKLFSGCKNIEFIQYKATSRIRYITEIPSILQKGNFDYAHFQYVIPPFKTNKKTKIIVTIHDILYYDFPEEFPLSYRIIRDLTFKYSARNADIITTVSNYSRVKISEIFKIPQENIYLIPNGLSEEFMKDYSKGKAKAFIEKNFNIKNEYILYVSRIEPRKNHELLLSAYLKLKLWGKNIDLIFIGKETIKNKILKKILKNIPDSIKEKIHIFSSISPEEVKKFYLASRLMVYPSKAEGFGIPVIEAFALGIPTLFSYTTSMSEFSFAKKGGFDPYSLESLMEKITKQLEGDLFTEDELEKIKKYVRDYYNWERISKKFYEQVLI